MSYTTGFFDIVIYSQKKDYTQREESENYTKLKKKLGIQNQSDTRRIRELEINEQIEALRSKFINIISTKYYENCDWLSEIVYHFLKYVKNKWMKNDKKTDTKFHNRLKILEYYVHNTYHNIQPLSNSLTYSQINSLVSNVFGLSCHIEPEYRAIGGRGYVDDDEEFYGINIIFERI